MSQSLAQWLRVLRQAPALGGGRWRRLPGALLVWRDAAPFVRIHFLAVATDLGLLEELRRRPATVDQLSDRLAIGNPALLDAFLRLGVALGELRCRAGRWSLRGRRGKALAVPGADTMRAMAQEAVHYDAAVYAGLAVHLRGAPPDDYLAAAGAVIARASRLVEPVLAPLLRSVVAERRPRRVLDVGCGTGVYLVHAATAGGPKLTGLGVDLDAGVVDLARRRLADARLAGRFDVRHADVRTAELEAASFDLVLLFQNIYYFAEDQRPDLLRRHRGLRPAAPPPATRPSAPQRRLHHHTVGAAHPTRVVPRGRGAALRLVRAPPSTIPGDATVTANTSILKPDTSPASSKVESASHPEGRDNYLMPQPHHARAPHERQRAATHPGCPCGPKRARAVVLQEGIRAWESLTSGCRCWRATRWNWSIGALPTSGTTPARAGPQPATPR